MMQVTITLELENEQIIPVLTMLSGFCQKEGSAVITEASKKAVPKAPAPTTEDIAYMTESANALKGAVAIIEDMEKSWDAKPDVTESVSTKIDMTELRAAAKALVDANKGKVLQEIFTRFNAKKLSQIDPANYTAVYEALVKANG